MTATRYRIYVRHGNTYEPHPVLPTFGSMTEAELAAVKIAGPTRVDAEIAERSDGNGAGAAIRKDADKDGMDGSHVASEALHSTSGLATPSPQPLRCGKCGIWKDSPSRPFDDPNSICYRIEDHYAIPNGDHEWGEAA